MERFPEKVEEEQGKAKKESKNVAVQIFGSRFHADQSMYEYLIEFLLVFCSAKDKTKEIGKMQFHKGDMRWEYYAKPRMGFKRFVFYAKSRKKGTMQIDERAQKIMNELLRKRIDTTDDERRAEILEDIRDLFHGYAVVIKDRDWCAQALMPLCPEMIFTEAQPNRTTRKKIDWDTMEREDIDMKFQFSQRNFLARGGELYYLHLVQGLQGKEKECEELERLLRNLLSQNKKMSQLADLIQKCWEEGMQLDREKLYQRYPLGYIPKTAYVACEEYSIQELMNFLSCNIDPVKRIELLAKGVIFQIMRMMTCGVQSYLGIERKNWIVDMCGKSEDTIKKLAAESYAKVEDDFVTALNKKIIELEIPEEEQLKILQKGRRETVDLFRAKGKELQCIIPINGVFQRFTLSEDIIRFLVLAIVRPQDKMTLTMFLDKLYEHYGIVIGPEEYKKTQKEDVNSLASIFEKNVEAFQEFLRATGFLRELSDATSIVVNPYTRVELEEER